MEDKSVYRQKLATIEKHYRRIAKDYDRLRSYPPEFVDAMAAKVIAGLRLVPDDRFIDLGCGTGLYAVELARQIQFENKVFAVDPYIEMIRLVPEGKGVRTVMMDALIFSRQAMVYNKVLMKESVHYVLDRAALFENLFRRLPIGGRLLLICVPPKIEYPLFPAATERAATWYADPAALAGELRKAGFAVGTDTFAYERSIPKATYLEMVRARFMSLLATFSDDEIGAGVSELEERYRDVDTLQFTDRFEFVLGAKQE